MMLDVVDEYSTVQYRWCKCKGSALLSPYCHCVGWLGFCGLKILLDNTAKTGLIGNGANTGGVNEASSPPWWCS